MLEEQQLTAQDVARMLHLGRNRVYELARTGELGSYRIGRKLFFTAHDVEHYLNDARAKSVGAAATSNSTAEKQPPTSDIDVSAFALAANGPRAVVAGSGPEADLLAGTLLREGFAANVLPCQDYGALVNLYTGAADIALTSLYDWKTNSCNIPYAQRLAPGMPALVIRLAMRQRGFAVAHGNPRRISTWGSLLHEGVRLANLPLGSASRVLLDGKLISLEARPENIAGYEDPCASESAAALRVAAGAADVCVVSQRAATECPDLDFIPLQTETLELVVRKSRETRKLVRAIRKLADENVLVRLLNQLGYTQTDSSGAIVYEC